MLLESGLSAKELRARVTSKGGTTEAAINKLEETGVRELWVRAIEAAAERAAEMSGDK
jgi:pyrroline-5-carboxylate reductase